MKHILNPKFFEIAKEYSIHNPELSHNDCFMQSEGFLNEYEKILSHEEEGIKRNIYYYTPINPNEMTKPLEEVISSLNKHYEKLLEIKQQNFSYRNYKNTAQEIINKYKI